MVGELLPTGKVLLFQSGAAMHLWDPQTGRFSPRFGSNTNLFCAGLAFLADGTLLAVGGHQGRDPSEQFLGLRSAEVFDPWQERWTRVPDMVGGERWYPTAVTLPDGRVLVASGIHAGSQNETIEIYEPRQRSWEVIARQRLHPVYPWAAVVPGAYLIFYGPQRSTAVFNWNASTFQLVSAMIVARPGGTGVLLDGNTGALLALGGGNPTTSSAEIFDPAAKAWRATAAMASPRHHPNAVLLPDGRVLVVGGHRAVQDREDPGAEGDVLSAETFDPQGRQWLSAGQTSYGHGYHSTALLLPDGSVLAAGPARTLERYFPWYFFARNRPAIEFSPGQASFGERFTVRTAAAGEIARVVGIRVSSTTHSLNTDQRYLELEFRRVGTGTLSVQAPPSPAVAPPGYYLLFVRTDQNVPSEGRFLRIG